MDKRRTPLGLRVCAIIMVSLFTLASGQIRAGADDAGVAKKLYEVLDNQEAIMESLSSIKEELKVIKIRVTQQQ